jgi:hypothetical protein
MANYYDGQMGAGDYTGQLNQGGDVKSGVAQGAAGGAAVGGPWGAIIGAAAGLLGGLIQQKDAEKARKLALELEQKRSAQDRLYGAQQRQTQIAGEMGNREQSAIQQLMGVFARSAR